MVPLYVPAARPARLTLAVIVPVLVPEAGVRVSQAALSLAVHVKVPEPVLETVKDWVVGLVPPAAPEKAKLVALNPITGAAVEAAVTVSETGMVLLLAPVAATVTVPLYVPAARPARLTLAVIVPVLVPEAGVRVSQAALSPAVHVKVPEPVLETLMVFAVGFVVPTVPENERVAGVRLRAGVVLSA